jgi:hypothetical protein
MPPTSSNPVSQVDKFGRDWGKLLSLQDAELKHWKRVLRPEVYEALADWCEMVNRQTTPEDYPKGNQYKAGGLHSCPVGCELHHFVMAFGRPKLTKEDLDIL